MKPNAVMSKNDVAARCLANEKEIARVTNRKAAREKQLNRCNVQKDKLQQFIKGCQRDITKSSNMLCTLHGEQDGLMFSLASDERKEVIDQLKVASELRKTNSIKKDEKQLVIGQREEHHGLIREYRRMTEEQILRYSFGPQREYWQYFCNKCNGELVPGPTGAGTNQVCEKCRINFGCLDGGLID